MSRRTLGIIQRIFGYALIVFGIFQIVTGFANAGVITFINQDLAHIFHKMYIIIPLTILATVHGLIGIRNRVRARVRARGRALVALDILFLIAGAGFISFVTYFALKS